MACAPLPYLLDRPLPVRVSVVGDGPKSDKAGKKGKKGDKKDAKKDGKSADNKPKVTWEPGRRANRCSRT